jgi:glycosyltransferase involved in cell wall biosynthesis
LSIVKVSLDARPLSTPVSGVGRLIAETLIHFPDKEKYHFYLHTHLPIHPSHKKVLDLPNITLMQGTGLLSKKGAIYFAFYLPFEIRKLKSDIFWGSQQVAPIGLSSKTPIVLTFCDLVLYLFPGTMRKLAAIQQKIFQSYSVKNADFILSISNSTRLDLLKKFLYPEERTGVAFPGVSQKDISLILKNSENEILPKLPEKYLLSVSTIEPRKNYKFLLSVYQKYREKSGIDKLPWIIVGKIGWETPEFILQLKSEITKYNDIIIINSSSDYVLHSIYSKCELFLFASIYEGFGIPLLEALAHKKKCLVSDIPPFHEIGGNEIPYLSTDDINPWVDKIIELINSMKAPSIDLEKFSWENSAIETHNAFQKVLQK